MTVSSLPNVLARFHLNFDLVIYRIQIFNFEEGDEGPFYLDARTQEAKKYDFIGKDKKAKPLTIAELTEKLSEKGIHVVKKRNKNWLNQLCIMVSH